MDIRELGLPNRAVNCLRNDGYRTLEDIKGLDINDLLRVPNLGKKTIEDIRELENKYNFKFKDRYEEHLIAKRQKEKEKLLKAYKLKTWRTIDSDPKVREVIYYPDKENATHWIDKPE